MCNRRRQFPFRFQRTRGQGETGIGQLLEERFQLRVDPDGRVDVRVVGDEDRELLERGDLWCQLEVGVLRGAALSQTQRIILE